MQDEDEQYVVFIDSLHMQELVQLTCVFSRKVNLLIQHIVVQDQDGQNINSKEDLPVLFF